MTARIPADIARYLCDVSEAISKVPPVLEVYPQAVDFNCGDEPINYRLVISDETDEYDIEIT